MYTFSMRPYCPNGSPNRCINFEQEKEAWSLSTFKKEDPNFGVSMATGLCFYSPLETVDISVKQLAALIAGVDTAYADLCSALYENAAKDLAGTPWKDRETFMSCIPRGIFEMQPELPRSVYSDDAAAVPFLYREGDNTFLLWDGVRWGVSETPPTSLEVGSCDTAGTCFGWKVLYNEQAMATGCVRMPNDLAEMVSSLLETLSYLDTDEKVYVKNIFSAQ